jgi:hypothetical protein
MKWFRPHHLDEAMYMEYRFMYMAIKHKHLRLDQSKIDRARRVLQVRTEQEAIERALELVIAEEPILRAHQKLRGTGGFADLLGPS